MAYSDEERASAIETVIAGLRKGTPLTVICSGEGMPDDDTIRDWADADADLSRAIARARKVGFDQIAMEALAIADETSNDTRKGEDGEERPNTEWITRSRLRVDTRLKLLAKWDPKGYGESVQLKHADADGEKLPADDVVTVTRLAAIVAKIQGRSDDASD